MNKEIEGIMVTVLNADGTEETRHATKGERGWEHGRVDEILSAEEMRQPDMARKVRDRVKGKENRPQGAAIADPILSPEDRL